MLTLAMMKQLWPHGNAQVPGLIEGVVAAAPTVFPKYGCRTDAVVAHAMAQFSHECGAGTEMVENLNYRAEQLLKQWPKHFTPAQAIAMQHNPRAIADQAYNGRMGNRPGTDDGWNFRGQGGSQLTGRENYINLEKACGLDVVNHPELLTAPDTFLETSVADFIMCGCLPWAIKDNVSMVTFKMNGGHIGEAQREHWLALWKHVLGVRP